MKLLNMTKHLNFLINIILFITCLFLLSCSFDKKRNLSSYLTNDSISMWDMKMNRLIKLKDTTYQHYYYKSFLFNKNLVCERYSKTKTGERLIDIIGPKPNYLGLCNRWEILNDSIIKLNCTDTFVIKIISEDTLYLFDRFGVKQHEMYRVDLPWNIDEESVKIHNEQIENEKYLDNKIY